MFTLRKTFTFEAAHKLTHHDGKCARLHGHSFKLTVEVKGYVIKDGPKRGMVIDYGDISTVVKPLLENVLDHHFLNETLQHEGPTSEVIAGKIFHYLKTAIPQLSAVEIEETCTASCRYETTDAKS